MSRTHWTTIAGGLTTMLLMGCGGPKTYSLTPRSAQDTIDDAPKWMLSPPAVDDHLTAAATMTSRDMQTAFDKARNMAQVDLAQQLGVRMANLSKQFQEEVGLASDSEFLTQFSSATKATTDETLVGARIDQQKVVPEGNVYRAYVLMRLPIGAANQLLMDKLSSHQNVYTRFRATQAYADLDAEIEKYRQQQAVAVPSDR